MEKVILYSIMFLILFTPITIAQDVITIKRAPEYAKASPGQAVDITLNYSLKGTQIGVIITEKLPLGWNIQNAFPAYSTYESETNSFKWLFLNKTGVVNGSIVYTIRVPEDAVTQNYYINGSWMSTNTEGSQHQGISPITTIEVLGVPSLFINVTTDKFTYYQGENVSISGWFGYENGTGVSKRVSLEIFDPNGFLVYETNLTSSYGFYAYNFTLPNDAALGYWTVNATGYGSIVKSSARFEVKAKAPYCGDGACAGYENCENCPSDCGCPSGYVCRNGVCIKPETGGTPSGPSGPSFPPTSVPGCKVAGENCSLYPCCSGLVCYKQICEYPVRRLEIIQYPEVLEILRNSEEKFVVKVKNTGNLEINVSLAILNFSECGNYSIFHPILNIMPDAEASFLLTFSSLNVTKQTECGALIKAEAENTSISTNFLIRIITVKPSYVLSKIQATKSKAERISKELEEVRLSGFSVEKQMSLLDQALIKISLAESEFQASRYDSSLSLVEEANLILDQILIPKAKFDMLLILFSVIVLTFIVILILLLRIRKKKCEVCGSKLQLLYDGERCKEYQCVKCGHRVVEVKKL